MNKRELLSYLNSLFPTFEKVEFIFNDDIKKTCINIISKDYLYKKNKRIKLHHIDNYTYKENEQINFSEDNINNIGNNIISNFLENSIVLDSYNFSFNKIFNILIEQVKIQKLNSNKNVLYIDSSIYNKINFKNNEEIQFYLNLLKIKKIIILEGDFGIIFSPYYCAKCFLLFRESSTLMVDNNYFFCSLQIGIFINYKSFINIKFNKERV